jgi:N-acetylglucosamine malate deacetylase 1
MKRSVLAIFAHPDDIEFTAAGTLLRLRDLGWQVHYMNLANGCCGSTTTDRVTTAAIRLKESQSSASLLGATHYPPLCDDLEVFYGRKLVQQVAAVIRRADPSIVLTHARDDYMEDHMETCRIAVTGAFARSVPNFETDPRTEIIDGQVAIYHAQPHGNRTPTNQIVVPDFAVDIDAVMDRKRAMLECHASQQGWLQSTQKMDSYVQTMLDLGAEVAQLSGLSCRYAEGWTRHLHLGFGQPDFDPLFRTLGSRPTK